MSASSLDFRSSSRAATSSSMLNHSGTLGRSKKRKEFQPQSGMVSLPLSAVAPSLKSLKGPFHRRIQAQLSLRSQPDNYNSRQYENKAIYQLFYKALAHDQRPAPTPARPISNAEYYTLHFCQRLGSPPSKAATVLYMRAIVAEQIRKIGGLPLRSGPLDAPASLPQETREKLKVSKMSACEHLRKIA